jgi:succinate-semialdehyde dehydrogenase/glutarate-semialdehyde dehydrogenase
MAEKHHDVSAASDADTYQMYIGGEWTNSESAGTKTATNPGTGEVLGTFPDGTRADARRAIDAANQVQKDLEFLSAFERAELVHDIADAIEARREELAEWLVADQGKPYAEAIAEVDGYTVKPFRMAAEDIKRDETDVINSEFPDKRIHTIRKPHGVYGVITPWNFPLNVPAEYISAGLAVGNTIVWVPAPSTSIVSVKLMEAIASVDALPDGAVNLVTGDGPVVGNEIVVNDGTDAIAFTGSPEVGEEIAHESGPKPVVLELGGNGPVIVLEDADVDAAVECVAAGSFSNAGQICTASERVLVHEAVHDEFVEKMADRASAVDLGNPTDEARDMGPLNNEAVAEKMDRHVEDAVEKGATVLTGGGRAEGFPTDQYYEATVLDGVTTEMVTNVEETFGPIVPVITFSDHDEAIEIANNIDLGLSAGIFTSNIRSMHYFAERIETGMININDTSANWEIHTPAGGHTGKRSGFGRYGGKYTIEEMSQVKVVSVDIGNVK